MTAAPGTGLPLYAQVADEVRGLIERGGVRPGDRLPTEAELATQYNVNRLTVRQAIAELARAGLVVPRQGAGTFVAKAMEPFTMEISAQNWSETHSRARRIAATTGRTFREELLEVHRADPPPTVEEHLGLGSTVWMESVHRSPDEPITRSQYWLRSDWTPERIRERAALGFDADAIQEIAREEMFTAWRSLEATVATRRDAAILDVPLGSPILRRCGVNSDPAGRPLLYLQRNHIGRSMRIVIRNALPSRSGR